MADRARLPSPLDALLDRIAREEGPGVLADARAAARARAVDLLAEELAQRILEQCRPARAQPATPRSEPPRRAADLPAHPPAAAPADPAPTAPAAGTVAYVYGVVDDTAGEPQALPAGIDGAPVTFVRHEGLRAAVSAVSAEEFGDDALKEHLNDLAWLERTARSHEVVVDALLAVGPVVPMRLCTIFRQEAGVCVMLEHERRQLGEALNRIRHAEELGVKVFAGPAARQEAAGEEQEREPEDGPARLTEGEAYMVGRRRQRLAAEESRERLDRWVTEVHESLSAAALDARVNPPTSRELGGYEGDMVLNAAYLVAESDVGAFRRRTAELGERHRSHGLRIELTGPWPPYNFTAREGAP